MQFFADEFCTYIRLNFFRGRRITAKLVVRGTPGAGMWRYDLILIATTVFIFDRVPVPTQPPPTPTTAFSHRLATASTHSSATSSADLPLIDPPSASVVSLRFSSSSSYHASSECEDTPGLRSFSRILDKFEKRHPEGEVQIRILSGLQI